MSRERSELEKLYVRLGKLSLEEREQELARLPVELAEAVRDRMALMVSQASLDSLDSDETLGTGERIGPYVLRECLGEGGMGTVYLASRGAGAANLALKLTQRGESQDLVRFEREAHILKDLRHPNICTAIDHGIQDGVPYLVMELVTGKDLKQCVLDSSTPLDPSWCAEVVLQAAEGLAAVHAQQVVHRDIKPRNVMVEERGGRVWVKIVDFGICRLTDGQERFRTEGNPGTFSFASPEQLRGSSEIGEPSDIYSLALTAVYLLTGGVVVATDRSRAIDQSAIESLKAAGIQDRDLIDCILQMLRETPSQRPKAEQVVIEMRRFLERRSQSEGIESRKQNLAFSPPRLRTAVDVQGGERESSGTGSDTSLTVDSTSPLPKIVAADRMGSGPSVAPFDAIGEGNKRESRAAQNDSSKAEPEFSRRTRLESRWIFLTLALTVIVSGMVGLWSSNDSGERNRSIISSPSSSGGNNRTELVPERTRGQTSARSGYHPLFDYQPIVEDLMTIGELDRPHMVYLAIPSALIPSLQQAGITNEQLRSAAAAALLTLDSQPSDNLIPLPQVGPLESQAIFRADLRDVFAEALTEEVRPDLLWSSELSDNPFALLPSDTTADDSWIRLHEMTAITSPVVRLDWLAHRAWKRAQGFGQSGELSSNLSPLSTWYDSLVLDAAMMSKLFDLPIDQLRQIEIADPPDMGWNWEEGGPNRFWETEVRGGESLFQFFSRSAGLGVPVLMH